MNRVNPSTLYRSKLERTRLIRIPLASKSSAARPSAASRQSNPACRRMRTTMSRSGFSSSTRRIRGDRPGWNCASADVSCLGLPETEIVAYMMPMPRKEHLPPLVQHRPGKNECRNADANITGNASPGRSEFCPRGGQGEGARGQNRNLETPNRQIFSAVLIFSDFFGRQDSEYKARTFADIYLAHCHFSLNMAPMWWHHLVNLLGRSWGSLVRATSTNTLGFIVWTVLITVMSWAATLAGTWFQLKRDKTEHPFTKALRSCNKTSPVLPCVVI